MPTSKKAANVLSNTGGELTAGQLIDELSKYPQDALIVFLGSTPESLGHTVSSVLADWDLSHLFDPQLEQPAVKVVYLKTRIVRLVK